MMSSLEILGCTCELGAQIGAGGMAQVFAAHHPVLGHLAVKVLAAELRGDPAIVARMTDEAFAGARVRHSNVVHVLDHGHIADGAPFVAMVRAEGEPLGLLVQREGPLPLPRIRSIAHQMLAGLDAIHRAGLVHADLKSDNVLIDASPR